MKRRLNRVRAAIGGHPIASLLCALVAGVLVAGGVAAADAVPKVNDLTSQRNHLATQLDQAEAARSAAITAKDQAQQARNQVFARRDHIISSAGQKADQIVGGAKDQLSSLNGKISDARSTLSSTQSKLDAVQASLTTAQTTKAKSSFSTGTWQENVDFIAGTYEAPGGPSCYWEKLNGPSGGGLNNIIDNGGFDRNQIVSVDSPYFHTDDCGTWTRVG